ncbi:flagellar protein FliT [Caldibacillus lycopersici]|uniref:Flagellar protein FliT n=1 Tax=Perspicuibacillus lycopersici TaxID=1325689 RepID=A0AAE3IUC0_9BACI|nr:flagellar protein FliT [Perspicuibacillus lycopersici]MCU9612974.1 flagellar protein FliT [Perspicuibacillus lycopersici]
MSSLNDFYLVTTELIQRLEEDTQDRDNQLHDIQLLLNKRDEHAKQMVPPFSEEEQKLGKQILSLNETLIQLLTKQKQIIQTDLRQLQKRKQSGKQYINPYQSIQTDGYFYDKRK